MFVIVNAHSPILPRLVKATDVRQMADVVNRASSSSEAKVKQLFLR